MIFWTDLLCSESCGSKSIDRFLHHLRPTTALDLLQLFSDGNSEQKISTAHHRLLKLLSTGRGTLRLRDVDVSNSFCTELCRQCSGLQELILPDCAALDDDGLKCCVEAFSQLPHLCFHRSRNITNNGLRHVASLSQLRYLDASRCGGISASGLQHLVSLAELRTLYLYECGGAINDGLVHVATLSQLQHLDISGKQLRHLDIANSKVTSAGMEHLASLSQLTHLNMSGCSGLRDDGLKHLVGLPLEHLDLSKCYAISDKGVAHLSFFPRLQQLSLI